jgi:hypothetical protein
MTLLLVLLGLVGYAAVGAWTWGYTRGAVEDDTGWETPVPLLAGLFWPFILTGIMLKLLLVPMQSMGFALQQKKMLQKKQRIELQTKTRIELEEAERELEEFDLELEEAKKKKARR